MNVFTQTRLKTILGDMICIASDDALLLLEFTDRKGLQAEFARLRKTLQTDFTDRENAITRQIQRELADYFAGKCLTFETPIQMIGTDFQKQVWKTLQTIKPGKTCSYAEVARNTGRPQAYRAVARANSTNQLAIVVPCHRVINSDGKLGGYAGGLDRKEWLLAHEAYTEPTPELKTPK